MIGLGSRSVGRGSVLLVSCVLALAGWCAPAHDVAVLNSPTTLGQRYTKYFVDVADWLSLSCRVITEADLSDMWTIDDICKESYVDTDRLGCVGASFGGYTAMWMAGHHNKRFKAFIAHDGFFNMEQQYFETEESWFTNWDLGGAPHEKNAKTEHSYANSPHKFVDKWDTPILLIHGDLDYRILSSQSMAAFNAAKLKGVPAQLLLFPDENHWVLKPQNGILWQRTFFAWLDKWVKGAK